MFVKRSRNEGLRRKSYFRRVKAGHSSSHFLIYKSQGSMDFTLETVGRSRSVTNPLKEAVRAYVFHLPSISMRRDSFGTTFTMSKERAK